MRSLEWANRLALRGGLTAAMVVLLIMAAALTACPKAPPDPLLATQAAAHETADTFIATNAMMRSGCEKAIIQPATCSAWRTFVPRFQKGYHLSRVAWEGAGNVVDADGGVAETLEALAKELLVFYREALAAFGGTP